jgi:aspartyl-tRNA(Asn)/glutamyl-tRNA(Gln) amidotransferase subunit A
MSSFENHMKLAFATITELKEKLANKEITIEEMVDYFIERFKKFDPKVGAALEVFSKDSILKEHHNEGILNGIPGLIKDNICQKDRITSCASKILENFSSTYDATAVQRLKHQGSLLMGRANMDEFAMGSSTETSAFGKTYNPWDSSRVPGGSSGGSIAAVAAGLVPYALGSETGGSVRQPAAFCNVVGLKPTYGLISRSGLVAYASSLDQIGIATRTVKDNAIVLSAIAGQDIHDSTTLNVEQTDYTQGLTGSIKAGLTIGIIDNALQVEGLDPEVRDALDAAIKQLESLGANAKKISLPTMDYGAAVYFIVSRAEAASNLARFDGVRYGYRNKQAESLLNMYEETRSQGFGQEVQSRIMVGNYVLSAGYAGKYYNKAKLVQNMMRQEFHDAFEDVDMLLAPVHAAPAFKLGAFDNDKLQMDLQDYFTCPANLTGIPAISIPCGFTKEGLPIGFQLMGPHLSEKLLLQTAHAYEQSTPWHTKHPIGFE